MSGERIYFHSDNSNSDYLKSGKYFVKKVSETQISLAFNQSDLFSEKYMRETSGNLLIRTPNLSS